VLREVVIKGHTGARPIGLDDYGGDNRNSANSETATGWVYPGSVTTVGSVHLHHRCGPFGRGVGCEVRVAECARRLFIHLLSFRRGVKV